MSRVKDKYDRAIEFFKACPDMIETYWNYPKANDHGCLFQFCGDDETAILEEYQTCGCLTMIRDQKFYAAQTPELTEAIAKDKRIPKSVEDITVDKLPVFAEWQRKLDRYKFRKVKVGA